MEEFEKNFNDTKALLGNFLKKVEELKVMQDKATEAIEYEERYTRDILHYLELEDIKRGEYQTLGKELRESRKRRRIAIDTVTAIKNLLIANTPLEDNNIKQCERMLNNLCKYKPYYKKERAYKYNYFKGCKDDTTVSN